MIFEIAAGVVLGNLATDAIKDVVKKPEIKEVKDALLGLFDTPAEKKRPRGRSKA